METVTLPGGADMEAWGKHLPRFSDEGVLRGVIGAELTPENLAALGVVLGAEGKTALGWSGGGGAAMLARALGAGINAGGGAVLTHDGCCPAAAAWLGEYYALPASLFVEQNGEQAYLHWFDRRGMSAGTEATRRLEHQLGTGGQTHAEAGRVGQWEHLTGVNSSYAADAARRVRRELRQTPTVSVPGESSWDQALADLLERIGCRVLRHHAPDVPAFSAVHGGFRLEAVLEDGAFAGAERLLTLVALLELERGRPVAVPASAPAVLERAGGPVLRLGRDREAEGIYAASPWLRDALFAAGYLAAAMGAENTTLADLLSRLPKFTLRLREIPLRRSQAELMDAFTGQFRRAEPAGNGVRLSAGAGWVYVAPLLRRQAVRLQAEGADAEIAEELCIFYENEIRRLDRGK